jgi:basic amino acid/polyamine antiporter, APA family
VNPRSLEPPHDRGLSRALGRWDLVAFVINGIVGAGIFGLPAKVQSLLGVYGIWAILACAAIMALVVLCFAEVASRFVETGGPFVYVGAAFGPLPGFLTGWVLWIARVTGACAICNLLLQYTALLDPDWSSPTGRVVAAALIFGTLTVIHYLGVRRAALFGNVVTVGKLVPLLIFVSLGLFHLDPARFAHSGLPDNTRFAEAVLLLGFAFVGWEDVVVAAGEARNPQRDVPHAIIAGLCAVAVLYLLIQVVCIGTLPQLAGSARPIVDAGRTFLGPSGALLITLGAAVSMIGTLNGAMLTISRLLYAMAAEGRLPRKLAAVHRRYRTPHVAVALSGILMFGLTVSSQFVYLLTVSTISRLLVFAATCVSLPRLRQLRAAPAARFVLPGGLIIPGAALLLVTWLLASSSWTETRDVGICTAVGALIYAFGHWRGRHATRIP